VAIDLITGNIKWKYPITTVTYGGGALVDPTDGTIYQCGTDSKVYAINPDGTSKWIANVDGVIGAFPALAGNGTFYCITNAGTLFALNASSGAEIWKKTTEGANTGSAVVVGKDGIVYAGTNKGLFAFTSDGEQRWSNTSLNVTERGAMAMADSVIYVALKASDGVAAVNVSDGSVEWKAPANGDAYCPIIDKSGVIYFTEKGTSPNFNVYAINPSDGSRKWVQNAEAALTYDGLVLGDNGVVYGGTQGKFSGNYRVFGLNTADGSFALDETSDTHQIMCGAAIGPDRRLYLGTITTGNIGYLNAYEINAGLETDSWSVRGGNMQGTNCISTNQTSIFKTQKTAMYEISTKANALEVKVSAKGKLTVYDLMGNVIFSQMVETGSRNTVSVIFNTIYLVEFNGEIKKVIVH
jgi:outer membrane protein assembly factor BamB